MINISSKKEALANEIVKNWKKKYFRDFQWRSYTDPYKVMIAEFMLHRTKAKQVLPVYIAFLKKYPDIFKLSDAAEKEISKVTIHLGLHWRAKHFIEAAKYIVKKYNGQFPEEREKLQSIPGVGEYVAGAILTVCHKRKVYVIDSNIARFLNKFYGLNLSGEIRRKKIIKIKAMELFDYHDTRQLLFALLDFTAIVCKPKTPDCNNCILSNQCQTGITDTDN